MLPQLGHVLCADRGAIVGEALGEQEQGHGGIVEAGAPPILGEPVHHLLIVDLIPEVVQMRRYSVVALVHL